MFLGGQSQKVEEAGEDMEENGARGMSLRGGWLRYYWEDKDTEGLRAELASLADELCSSELKVLLYVGERLAAGQRQYGRLDPLDGRDWDEEARQEAADMMVYLAAGWMKGSLKDGVK